LADAASISDTEATNTRAGLNRLAATRSLDFCTFNRPDE
jgi:hypothetical protein